MTMIEDIKEIVRRREEAAKSLSHSLRHLTTEQAYYILTSTMSVEALEEFSRVQSQLVEALRKIAQQKTSSELGSDEQYADYLEGYDTCVREARSDLAAYEASKATRGARYQHLKTGGFYQIISRAKLEWNLASAVVYRSEHDGSVWIRPEAEFFDGRFSPVGGLGKVIMGADSISSPSTEDGAGLRAARESAPATPGNFPVIDDIVKQVVLKFLVEISCVDCMDSIKAMRPKWEQIILEAFFRCADSRAEQLRKERDEALEVLMRLVVAYDVPSYSQVMPDAAPAWTEARKILNKIPENRRG